jgi:hypothetical protein
VSLLLAAGSTPPPADDLVWSEFIADDGWQPVDEFDYALPEWQVESPAAVDDSETRPLLDDADEQPDDRASDQEPQQIEDSLEGILTQFDDSWQPDDETADYTEQQIEDAIEFTLQLLDDIQDEVEWIDGWIDQIVEDATTDDSELRPLLDDGWESEDEARDELLDQQIENPPPIVDVLEPRLFIDWDGEEPPDERDPGLPDEAVFPPDGTAYHCLTADSTGYTADETSQTADQTICPVETAAGGATNYFEPEWRDRRRRPRFKADSPDYLRYLARCIAEENRCRAEKRQLEQQLRTVESAVKQLPKRAAKSLFRGNADERRALEQRIQEIQKRIDQLVMDEIAARMHAAHADRLASIRQMDDDMLVIAYLLDEI